MSYRRPCSGLNTRPFLSSWIRALRVASGAPLGGELLRLHRRDLSQQLRWLAVRDRHQTVAVAVQQVALADAQPGDLDIVAHRHDRPRPAADHGPERERG